MTFLSQKESARKAKVAMKLANKQLRKKLKNFPHAISKKLLTEHRVVGVLVMTFVINKDFYKCYVWSLPAVRGSPPVPTHRKLTYHGEGCSESKLFSVPLSVVELG